MVLELCPTRYKDLMKYVASRDANKNTNKNNNSDNDDVEANKSSTGVDFFQMVSKMMHTRGIPLESLLQY